MDRSGCWLDELAKNQNTFARLVTVKRIIGYGHGIQEGSGQARADVVALSHADLESPPEDSFKAFSIYQKEARQRLCLIKGQGDGRSRPLLIVL